MNIYVLKKLVSQIQKFISLLLFLENPKNHNILTKFAFLYIVNLKKNSKILQ